LKVVPDPFPVVAEELVPGDLVGHRPLVQEPETGAVGPDCPDPVHLVPGPFVAEEQAVRVGRRRLQVVEPLRRVVNLPGGAGLDVGDDEGQRPPTGPETAGWFVPPNQVGRDQHRQAEFLHFRGGDGVGHDADDESLVGVDDRPPRSGQLAGSFRLEVGGVQDSVLAVVHVRGPPGGGDGLGAQDHNVPDDRPVAEPRQVDGGDPGPGVEDQRVPLRGVGVLVEVQAGAALIAGEPDDPMPGGRVDPVGRHGLGLRSGVGKGGKQAEQKEAWFHGRRFSISKDSGTGLRPKSPTNDHTDTRNRASRPGTLIGASNEPVGRSRQTASRCRPGLRGSEPRDATTARATGRAARRVPVPRWPRRRPAATSPRRRTTVSLELSGPCQEKKGRDRIELESRACGHRGEAPRAPR
jgi:hypothetical protein